MKTNIFIDISLPYMAKFWVSSNGSKSCQPINLQDFLICIILRKKWIMKFVFCMQINIEIFYKVLLPFWVSVTRHAQSTQSKFPYIYNISIKAWGMKLIFCLQINIKVLNKMIVSLMMYVGRHAQTTQNNRFTIPLQ